MAISDPLPAQAGSFNIRRTSGGKFDGENEYAQRPVCGGGSDSYQLGYGLEFQEFGGHPGRTRKHETQDQSVQCRVHLRYRLAYPEPAMEKPKHQLAKGN